MAGNLQLWLAVLGGVALAGLVGYNAWTTRKLRVRSATSHAPTVPVQEPVFDAQDTVPMAPDARDAGPPAAADSVSVQPAMRKTSVRLDPLIDALVTLRLDAPLAAEQLLPHFPTTRRAGSKPFFIEGLDAETGTWEPIVPQRRYGELQAGVQMANRTGALNEIEYSEFVQKLQGFADTIGAAADFPDMLDVVVRARELDQFAGEHDAQLVMRLRAKDSAWSVGYIQQHASRHGFIPGLMGGRLVLPAREEGAPPVLSLTFDSAAAFADDPNQAAVRELTLAFDVPQTAPEQEPFLAWRAAGEAMATTLSAQVTDDAGQPLAGAAFDSIGQELARLYEALAKRDLGAGSQLARRLFS
ncbi:MAG: cell division protein FtsZ [Aquabacterium sp.]|nr:MAG: cell division protein FtsZ [Aquabacterium sp.]